MADLDATPFPSAGDEPSSSGQNAVEHQSRKGVLGNCSSGCLGCLIAVVAVIAVLVVIRFAVKFVFNI